MRDDYLWDRSGESDPEIAGLERTLAVLRHRGVPPRLAARSLDHRWKRGSGWPYSAAAGVIAALLILVVGALLIGLRPPGAVWHVAVLEGRPTVGWFPLDKRGTLAVGQWLVTDASSRAQIDIGDIGSVEVAPNSRVRLVSARPADNRLELQLGRVRAVIFAPPRQFAVEAPSATAVDLGCVYTMQVTADGAGLLHVESGWVAFAHDGRESFVPAGASAQTRPGIGPGTPYFDDADPRMQQALALLDFGSTTSLNRAAALEAVLGTARARDGITLWHLLPRLHSEERARVFDRFAQLVPPPNTVTRAGILRGDRDMLEAWWDQLDLEPLSWWRVWERPWPGEKK
jgi:hypothetical protein